MWRRRPTFSGINGCRLERNQLAKLRDSKLKKGGGIERNGRRERSPLVRCIDSGIADGRFDRMQDEEVKDHWRPALRDGERHKTNLERQAARRAGIRMSFGDLDIDERRPL